jgi:hypothetical protein
MLPLAYQDGHACRARLRTEAIGRGRRLEQLEIALLQVRHGTSAGVADDSGHCDAFHAAFEAVLPDS